MCLKFGRSCDASPLPTLECARRQSNRSESPPRATAYRGHRAAGGLPGREISGVDGVFDLAPPTKSVPVPLQISVREKGDVDGRGEKRRCLTEPGSSCEALAFGLLAPALSQTGCAALCCK